MFKPITNIIIGSLAVGLILGIATVPEEKEKAVITEVNTSAVLNVESIEHAEKMSKLYAEYETFFEDEASKESLTITTFDEVKKKFYEMKSNSIKEIISYKINSIRILSAEEKSNLRKSFKTSVDKNTEELEALKKTWLDSIAAEKARIAEEERIKAEQEAARKAAEAYSAPTPQYSSNVQTYNNPGAPRAAEDPYTRVNRIAQSAGLWIPVIIGESCAAYGAAVGCYGVGTDFIEISSFGLTYSDCYILYAIAHEYRHYYQYTNGLIEYDASRVISNSGWLENDANAFARSYSSCRP